MAQWKLNFRVDVERMCKAEYPSHSDSAEKVASNDANAILRAVSKVDPRPIHALYDSGCVKMSFIIDAENQSQAHGEQSRIHDSLSKAIDEAKHDYDYAIEFDPPQEVEAGTKLPQ